VRVDRASRGAVSREAVSSSPARHRAQQPAVVELARPLDLRAQAA
jgi:hypothetical protein